MNTIAEISVVYKNTKERMEKKGFKFLSDLEPRSFLIERFEFWIDKFGTQYILELQKNGAVFIYKETKI